MKKLSMIVLTAAILSLTTILPIQANSDSATVIVPSSPAVYINQADEEMLVSLKGIGHKKAQAIIAFREINGEFKTIDDLLKVKGIGKHVLVENKQRLKI